MRYLIYDKKNRMYAVYESKCHPTKPEIQNTLIVGAVDLNTAIAWLRGDKK